MFGKKKKETPLDDDENLDYYSSESEKWDDQDGDDGYDIRDPKPDPWKIILSVLVVVVLLAAAAALVLFWISPGRGRCRGQLETLQELCNELDYSGLRVFVPKEKSNEYFALIYSTEMTDEDKEKAGSILDATLFDGALTRASTASGTTLEEVLRILVIEPTHYSLPGKERTVTCSMYVGAYEEELQFAFVKKDGKLILSPVK